MCLIACVHLLRKPIIFCMIFFRGQININWPYLLCAVINDKQKDMDGETSPVSELGVGHVVGLNESPTLDSVTHCNLNDLQSYLVNFNKEIEVNNDGGISIQNTLAKVITPNNRPMFVSLPGKLITSSQTWIRWYCTIFEKDIWIII